MTLHRITDHYVRWSDRPQSDAGVEPFAGGTDLIPLTRSGAVRIPTLADLKGSGLADTVERTGEGWAIGPLTTLARLADHDELVDAIPAVRDAVVQSATPQIRNRATVAGNLLQRPRCSYFRDPAVDACWVKGGTGCAAREGCNELHALVDAPCVATQPSDLASVLVAVDAAVDIDTSGDGPRSVPVAEFLQAPTESRCALHTLAPGEIITSITVPSVARRRSTYLKAMDRAVWQFALVGVAAVIDVDESGSVTSAGLVASGVNSVPHRLSEAEAALATRPLSATSIEAAADASSAGLVPLSDNGYKIALLRGLVVRALQKLQPVDTGGTH